MNRVAEPAGIVEPAMAEAKQRRTAPTNGKHVPELSDEAKVLASRRAEAIARRDKAWRDRPPGSDRSAWVEAYAAEHPDDIALIERPAQEVVA